MRRSERFRAIGWALFYLLLVSMLIGTEPAFGQGRASTSGRSETRSKVQRQKSVESRERQEPHKVRADRGKRVAKVSRGRVRTERDKSRSRIRVTERDRRGGNDRVAQRERSVVRNENDRRTQVIVSDRPSYRHRDRRYVRHHDRYYVPRRHVRYWHHQSGIYVNIRWPWVHRYHRHWVPRYRYRQVVYVDAGWGHRTRRSKIDVQTYYRHSVLYANDDYARIDVEIEKVEFYRDGRYLGEAHRFPRSLSHVEATLYNNGEVQFDRDLFVIGAPTVGFEMVSTQSYDGNAAELYRRSDVISAGRVDLNRGRVEPIRYSRLFDPGAFDGYVPISLLPDDASWLSDYDDDEISYENYGADNGSRRSMGVSGGIDYQTDRSGTALASRKETKLSFKASSGARVQMKHESEIHRIK